jgi:hypothetical protein
MKMFSSRHYHRVSLIFLGSVLVFLTATFLPATVAQTAVKPSDFSGTWELVSEKKGTSQTQPTSEKMTLLVVQDATSVKVTRTQKIKDQEKTEEIVYYPDKRGEKNAALFGKDKLQTTSSWSKEDLLSEFSFTRYAQPYGQYFDQRARYLWELSKDGKALTIMTQVDEIKNLPDSEKSKFPPSLYLRIFRKIQ